MDSDRKYKQRGYQDSPRESNGNGQKADKPRQSGPRPPLDITGPRLPRMVQTVAASRCFSCSVALSADADFRGNCPKCGAALHCCKQCVYFEPSTRFQCLKAIPVRIAVKDQANECELFKPRVTVARDSASPAAGPTAASIAANPPRRPDDARAAFDSLFKK